MRSLIVRPTLILFGFGLAICLYGCMGAGPLPRESPITFIPMGYYDHGAESMSEGKSGAQQS